MTRYPSLDSRLKSDQKKHKNTRRNKSKSENLNLGVENKQLFFKELSMSIRGF